ncbi:alpha/beta fold hydrolase [Rhizobium sp. L1K21]|uniref:alpha/beta fold hydrolase n=1 Tax=Rhizobium sp. L1K21 TaxID=2954933 RepID=UPI00209253EF|nr:alpha/beta fold hydrolase [Rhizobium sp. L1K21]MCO6185244.1 alpha/beta fold hydrolase [Rhizobium sp. L1K21]
MRYDPPFHRTNGLWPTLILIALAAVAPFVISDSYTRHLLILAFMYAIVASSWDFSLGFGGLFNFAHGALFAVGLYTYALTTKFLAVSPWLALVLAGAAAIILAVAIALPVLRLDGIYVILVTIAVSQLLYQITVSQSDFTGGTSGVVSLPGLKIGKYPFIRDGKIGYYYTALALLVISTAFLYAITRSRLGRAAVALRDNKFFAIARGVSEARTRVLTLAASALFTGIAGGFYGSYVRVASPDVYGTGFLTTILSILLVGGAATLWGPIAAAFLITFLSELLVDLGPWREIIMGLIIILVVVFYPGGLWAFIQELREKVDGVRTGVTATYRRKRGKTAREAMMSGAKESYIRTLHGLTAISDSGGNLPALLLIHGNSACKEAFYKQYAALKDRFRLIAFDLPGHGVSSNADPETTYNAVAYAEVAESVLADRGVSQAYVFGWSLGGYVALELAARENVKILGLAIAGTSPLTVVPDDFADGYDASSHLILSGKQFFTAQESYDYASSATAPKSAESAFMHRNLPRTDGRARAYMMTKLAIVNWPRQMRRLWENAFPFAIVNGDNDPFLNHDYIRRLSSAEDWPHVLIEIEDGKHAPFFNKPDEFNKAIVSLFAGA